MFCIWILIAVAFLWFWPKSKRKTYRPVGDGKVPDKVPKF